MDAFLERILEHETEIDRLRVELQQRDKTIEGMKHWLKVAAVYRAVPKVKTLHDADPIDTLQRTVEGIQAALLKASEYEGRRPNRKRK